MPRVISLFLPFWPTDRLRRQMGTAAPPADIPLVLAGQTNRRRVVLAADKASQTAGLHPGTDLTKAKMMVPNLVIHDADPAADHSGLLRLASWLLRYAPIVAVDHPPDGLVIEATGCAHLFGGEAAMLKDITTRLARFGCCCRIAIADHWGAAHALARFGADRTIVPPDGAEAALRPLPIAALRLPAETVTGLRRLGFERIGDLLGQPRAPLALRFGNVLWRRIDQALGHAPEPITPHRPPETPTASRNFAEPIATAAAIAETIQNLVNDLCKQLLAQGVGARRLDLLLHRVDRRTEAIRVGTAMPERHPARLARLLTDKIETIDPGLGIETAELAAIRTDPLAARQTISTLAADPETDLAPLIDLLANRLGADHIYRVAAVESDIPERAVTKIAPFAPGGGRADWPAHWPRPARLLAPPERIETIAALPDHPPVTFRWRGVRHRVRCADGPERVFGEWWKCDAELAAVRDYFRVENEAGGRFWIFRAGDGLDPTTGSLSWYMHGFFG